MNYIRTILTSVILCLGFAAAAQNVTIDMKQRPLGEVLDRIGSQTSSSFLYSRPTVNPDEIVSIHLENATLEEALATLFAGKNISYEIKGKKVYLVGRDAPQQASVKETPPGIRCLVSDSGGEPLLGATVQVKGSRQWFVTDNDGRFTLSGVSYPATLVITYVGYNDKTVTVNGNEKTLGIVFEDDLNELQETVIVGYGTQKKVNLTGAVSVVDGKDLNGRPVTNAAVALQGADPSLIITSGNGNPRANQFSVNIRGQLSIKDSSPLILIDGIEGSMEQVNPNDIESVSVLKDASACAIYGAKASAGVVLINTKSGTKERVKITYNGRVSLSRNTTSTDFITTGYDYVTLCNEFYIPYKGYNAWTYTDDQLQMLYERRNDKTENPDRPWVLPDVTGNYTWVYLGNFDWYGYFMKRIRPETEHNISVRGGNDKAKYYVSGRYLYREGMFGSQAEDALNSFSMRSKVDLQITPWLKYSNNLSFERMNYQWGSFWEIDGSDGLTTNGLMFSLSQNIGPNLVPYNPDGTFNMQPGFMADTISPLASGRAGPFVDDDVHNADISNYYTLTNRFTATLFKGLDFIVDYSYRRRDRTSLYRCLPTPNSYDNAHKQMYSGNGLSGGFFSNGSVYDFYRQRRYYRNDHIVNAYLQFGRSFGDHNVSATLGGNYDFYRSDYLQIQQKGSLNRKLSYIKLADGEIQVATEGISAYKTLGFFGRVNYDWKGRYLLEVSGRYDGSSRFPEGSRWGFFPSASAGWRISEEPFWTSIKPVVSNAKLRFSYGSLGNQQVDNYAYWELISTGNLGFSFDGTTKAGYARASDLVSSGLTWETVTTKNLGLDLGFFRGRLSLTADFYIRDTKNMLTDAMTLPVVFGEDAPEENAADMQTKGYEITMSWHDSAILGGKPLNYGITASLGDNVTHITRFRNEDGQLSDYYEGKRLGEIWGYRTDGLFATDEDAAAYEAAIDASNVQKGVFTCVAPYNHLMAGDIIFKDLDKNGKINSGANTLSDPGDREVIGNRLPRYNYALKGDVSWNGIDLSVFFQGVGKINWFPNYMCIDFYGLYGFQRSSFVPSDFEARCWSAAEGADNSKALFPRRRAHSVSSTQVVSDFYLQNASYLRLKNLTLGYTLPIKTRVLDKVRFYFTGENLFYLSPMKKYTSVVDPEVATTAANQDSMYPLSRTYSLGVDITF